MFSHLVHPQHPVIFHPHHPQLHHPQLHHPQLHHPQLHHPQLHHPQLHHPQLHHTQQTHQTHLHPIQPAPIQKSAPAPAQAQSQKTDKPDKPGEPTVPVIENPNEILLRFLIGCFIIFCMILSGIGIWCAQVMLNDKTRQSEKKKDIGNALLVISGSGIGCSIFGIISLFFLKINKMFIFVPIFLIFIGVVGTLFSSLSVT